jgi:predicted small metal-binding protein
MEKVLHCECGFEVHADSEAELIAGVQRHALSAHGMPFSREDVLRLVHREERTPRQLEKGKGEDTCAHS